MRWGYIINIILHSNVSQFTIVAMLPVHPDFNPSVPFCISSDWNHFLPNFRARSSYIAPTVNNIQEESYKTPLPLPFSCIHHIKVVEGFINDDIPIERADDVTHCNKLTMRILACRPDRPRLSYTCALIRPTCLY